MNTVKSFWLGWGSLCVAGAGAYYFAKKEINRDRRAKLEAQRQKKDAQLALQYEGPTSSSVGGNAGVGTGSSPSRQAGTDAPATGHAPAAGSGQVLEKSQYESSTPFRSRKGDRFS